MGAIALPKRIPDGTRYVIEGRPDKAGKMQIVSRHLILPDSKLIDLGVPTAKAESCARPRPATRAKRQSRTR